MEQTQANQTRSVPKTTATPQTAAKTAASATKGELMAGIENNPKLTKASLEKMIADGLSLEKMAAEANTSKYWVVKALKQTELKKGGAKVDLKTSIKVYTAIKDGSETEEKVAMSTGLDIAMVKATVKKLKREGEVKNTLSVVL